MKKQLIKAHILPIQTDHKKRLITIYSKTDIQRQKNLLERYGNQLAKRTHPAVFSYQKGKSCDSAAECVRKKLPLFRYYIKLDIKSYFPSMQKELAYPILRRAIGEAGAQEILRYVFWNGKGAAEGSPLSPAVSNIYLNDFDRTAAGMSGQFYIRYSDDILILTNNSVSETLNSIRRQLQRSKLQLNDSKTVTGPNQQGIPFLGKIIFADKILVKPKAPSEVLEKTDKRPFCVENRSANPNRNHTFLYWSTFIAQTLQTEVMERRR